MKKNGNKDAEWKKVGSYAVHDNNKPYRVAKYINAYPVGADASQALLIYLKKKDRQPCKEANNSGRLLDWIFNQVKESG